MRSLTVSEVARHISRETGCTVLPRAISTLFYKRRLDDERCPVVGRCRMIPEDYIPTIAGVLREQGLLPGAPESAGPDSA